MSERAKYCDKQCWDEGKCSGYCAGDGDPLPVTAGWAATNTLRGCISNPVVPNIYTAEGARALALVEQALAEAAEVIRIESTGVLPDFMPLAAALRAVREGK